MDNGSNETKYLEGLAKLDIVGQECFHNIMGPLGLCVEKVVYVSVGHLLPSSIYLIWEWRRSGLHCLSIIQHLPDMPMEICSTNATDYPWDLRVSVWKKWGTSLWVTCFLGIFLSMWPSRTLFTVFSSS
jgi:hypothetical protein